MITVAILSVLLAVAVLSYGRYVRSGIKAEVYGMLGEMRSMEESYLTMSGGSYLSTGSDETDIYPTLHTAGQEPAYKSWAPASTSNWAALGLRPPRSSLYCGYVAVAGAVGTAPAAGSAGASILSAAPVDSSGNITTPWWYGRACCDLNSPYDSATNCPASVSDLSLFEIGFNDNVVREQNDGQ
jgi:hypothetical protein